MMFRLCTTHSFERQLKKFVKLHPELKGTVAEVFRNLEKDPFQPHLRLHPLKGKLKGLLAVSITHSTRMILTIQISHKEITLLDIGKHDAVYR